MADLQQIGHDDASPPQRPDLLEELSRAREARNPGFPALVDAARRQRAVIRRLTERRKAQKLSQEEVAARMGTKQPAVARLERFENEPLLSTLHRYAAAINCELTLDLVEIAVDRPTFDEGGAALDGVQVGWPTEEPVRIELAQEEGTAEVVGIAHVRLAEQPHSLELLQAAAFVEVTSDNASVLYEKVARPVSFSSLSRRAARPLVEEPLAEHRDREDGRTYLTADR